MIVHAVFAPAGRKILRTACGRGKTDNLAALNDHGDARKRITCRNCQHVIANVAHGSWAQEGFHYSNPAPAAPKQLPPGSYAAPMVVTERGVEPDLSRAERLCPAWSDRNARPCKASTDGLCLWCGARVTGAPAKHEPTESEAEARWRKTALLIAALYAQRVPIEFAIGLTSNEAWSKVAQAAGVPAPSDTTVTWIACMLDRAHQHAVAAGVTDPKDAEIARLRAALERVDGMAASAAQATTRKKSKARHSSRRPRRST